MVYGFIVFCIPFLCFAFPAVLGLLGRKLNPPVTSALVVTGFLLAIALYHGRRFIRSFLASVFLRVIMHTRIRNRRLLARFLISELLWLGIEGMEAVASLVLDPSSQDWSIKLIAELPSPQYSKSKWRWEGSWRSDLISLLFNKGIPYGVLIRAIPKEDQKTLEFLNSLRRIC